LATISTTAGCVSVLRLVSVGLLQAVRARVATAREPNILLAGMDDPIFMPVFFLCYLSGIASIISNKIDLSSRQDEGATKINQFYLMNQVSPRQGRAGKIGLKRRYSER